MSGYLDGELTNDQESTLQEYLSHSEEGRAELERLRSLVDAASTLRVAAVSDEVWDAFYDNVYHRLERRSGWYIAIAGISALMVYLAFHFVVDAWASPAEKLLIAIPMLGFLILFISVLRQRLFVAKTDRYSRDIKR